MNNVFGSTIKPTNIIGIGLAVATVSLLATLFGGVGRAHAMTPFVCDNSAYVLSGTAPTNVYQLEFNPDGTITTANSGLPVATSGATEELNSLGYNPVDNMLYTSDLLPYDSGSGFNDTFDIYSIDATGVITNMGSIVVPNTADVGTLHAGTFGPDGSYYVSYRDGPSISPRMAHLVTVDVSGVSPVLVSQQTLWDTATFPGPTDMVYDPSDGELKFGTRSINPATAAWSNTTLQYGANANWIDGAGNSYSYSGVGDVSAHNPVTVIGSGPDPMGNQDGASCPFNVELTKSVTPSPVLQGDTVTYTYTFENQNAGATPIPGIDFDDTMDACRLYSSSPYGHTGGITTLAPNAGTGDGFNAIDISNITLPYGTSSFSIDVTFCDDATVGTHLNQASISGLPAELGGTVESDYPGTSAVDDPTPVEVIAAPQAGIAKSVGEVTFGDNAYVIPMTFVVENLGTVDLTNVQVNDDLLATFAPDCSATHISITVMPSTTGTLTPSTSYDGVADNNMLAAVSGTLAVGESETITLTAEVNASCITTPNFTNQATVIAEDAAGNTDTDLSDDGSSTDENASDGFYGSGPGEDDPSPITIPTGTITGTAYEDVNQDQTQDSNEQVFEGLTVTLYDEDGNVLGTTTTDSNGDYLFTEVLPGNYTVQISDPEGFENFFQPTGVVLGFGDTATEVDAGFIAPRLADTGIGTGQHIAVGFLTLLAVTYVHKHARRVHTWISR